MPSILQSGVADNGSIVIGYTACLSSIFKAIVLLCKENDASSNVLLASHTFKSLYVITISELCLSIKAIPSLFINKGVNSSLSVLSSTVNVESPIGLACTIKFCLKPCVEFIYSIVKSSLMIFINESFKFICGFSEIFRLLAPL